MIEPHLFETFIKERFAATEKGVTDEAGESACRSDARPSLRHSGTRLRALGGSAFGIHGEGGRTSTAHSTRFCGPRMRTSPPLGERPLAPRGSVLDRRSPSSPAASRAIPYRTKFSLPSASTVQRAAEAPLVDDELIERQPDGAHAIVEPFLTEWVLRYSS